MVVTAEDGRRRAPCFETKLSAPAGSSAEAGDPAVGGTLGVVGLAHGSDHSFAGGGLPFCAHALAGVAAPAFDERTCGENSSADFLQIVFMEPNLGGAVDFVAVVEEETSPVGVTVEIKAGNFDLIARLTVVQIIDQLIGLIEEDQIDAVFVPDADDIADEVGMIFPVGPTDVAGLVNQPGDAGLRAMFLLELLDADASGTNKISPPLVVRLTFEFFPFDEGWPTAHDDIFRAAGGYGRSGQDNK